MSLKEWTGNWRRQRWRNSGVGRDVPRLFVLLLCLTRKTQVVPRNGPPQKAAATKAGNHNAAELFANCSASGARTEKIAKAACGAPTRRREQRERPHPLASGEKEFRGREDLLAETIRRRNFAGMCCRFCRGRLLRRAVYPSRLRKELGGLKRGTSESPRHTWLTRYRCSLPGLAGFAGPRCTKPEVPRISSRGCDHYKKSSTGRRFVLASHFA
jgi:hypothetical protein